VKPSDGQGNGTEPASRAGRYVRDRRRRQIEALVVVVVVVAAGIYAWTQSRDVGAGAPTATRSVSPSPTAEVEPVRFLALSVRGAPAPLLAVIGTRSRRGDAAAIPIPAGLTMVVPGAGEMRAKDLSLLRGRSIQVGLSNLLGVWAEHYVVTDVEHLSAMVDRTGGLSTDLSQGFITRSGALGPGPVTLTGAQLGDLLTSTQGTEAEAAWQAVLGALLAHPLSLDHTSIIHADALASVNELLAASTGASTIQLPTDLVAGTTIVPSQPALDELMTTTFGTTAPISTIVQNGSGIPGVGEAVARRILPRGFRVVISENASSFNHATTEITANGAQNVGVARRLRRVLGVGRVTFSRVPSDVGDITVVVGEDFKV
jgi:hypothetical protein